MAGAGGVGSSRFIVDRYGGGGRYFGRPIGRSRRAVTNVGGLFRQSVVLIVSTGG